MYIENLYTVKRWLTNTAGMRKKSILGTKMYVIWNRTEWLLIFPEALGSFYSLNLLKYVISLYFFHLYIHRLFKMMHTENKLGTSHMRSASQISIFNYPDHLNPFYEEDNHNRLRFWNLTTKNNFVRRSFSIENIKELW